ncbi:MAG: GspE/PulE family protein [Kiritimatiellia bacterium]
MDTRNAVLLPLLERTGLFAEGQIESILATPHDGETGLVELLCEPTGVREADFLEKLAPQLGLAFTPLAGSEPPAAAIEKLPARAAFQYSVVPVSFSDGVLTVATNDPFDTGMVDGLRLATGCPVRIALAPGDEIAKAARKYYGVGADTLEKMLETGRLDVSDADTDISKIDLSAMGQEASVVRFVNQIIAEADKQGATDIHVEPMETELRIRYRIDGILHKVDLPAQLQRVQAAIISRIKVMANLDIAEKRLPMDGRIGIRANGKDIDIRVSTCPTTYGESVSLRLLQKSGGIVRFADLGMSDRDHRVIDRIIHRPNGILLVTGPTGSGKTTSLYAFLREINTIDKRILTAEDPIEYEMPGINQVQVRPDIGLSFARILRSFLRQDPDIMMVGEIRDGETAQIAVQASLTGHLVFSTLHTNDAAGAFTRLTDMGVEPYLIASSVAAVLAQRLVRRLCPACKAEANPDFTLLRSMDVNTSLFDNRKVHTPVGCDSCSKTGFKGRGAIFEVLSVSDAIQSLVTARAPSGDIKDAALKEGMTTLRDDGWRRVFDGFTTIEEILRVTEDQEE